MDRAHRRFLLAPTPFEQKYRTMQVTSQIDRPCIHRYIHTYIHKYTHTYIHKYTHTHIHTYIPVHTYIHHNSHTTTCKFCDLQRNVTKKQICNVAVAALFVWQNKLFLEQSCEHNLGAMCICTLDVAATSPIQSIAADFFSFFCLLSSFPHQLAPNWHPSGMDVVMSVYGARTWLWRPPMRSRVSFVAQQPLVHRGRAVAGAARWDRRQDTGTLKNE